MLAADDWTVATEDSLSMIVVQLPVAFGSSLS
jgi:hypothetical protein